MLHGLDSYLQIYVPTYLLPGRAMMTPHLPHLPRLPSFLSGKMYTTLPLSPPPLKKAHTSKLTHSAAPKASHPPSTVRSHEEMEKEGRRETNRHDDYDHDYDHDYHLSKAIILIFNPSRPVPFHTSLSISFLFFSAMTSTSTFTSTSAATLHPCSCSPHVYVVCVYTVTRQFPHIL